MSPENLPSIFTTEMLCRIGGPVPDAKAASRRAHAGVLAEHLPALMQRFEIDRPLRMAHFTGQMAHESDSFCTMEEYASGAAYEGRADLGNLHVGDGKRFKGRGPFQLTGRGNYRAFTSWMREYVSADAPDFEGRPELVLADRWVAYSPIYFWITRGPTVMPIATTFLRSPASSTAVETVLKIARSSSAAPKPRSPRRWRAPPSILAATNGRSSIAA